MESVLKYLIGMYEPCEMQLVIIRCGIFGTSISSHLKLLQENKNVFYGDFMDYCIKKEFTWHDVVVLDLLLAMSFPEKIRWRPLEVKEKGLVRNQHDSHLFANLLHVALLELGQYHDVTTRTAGTMTWYRISRPEQDTCCYIVVLKPDNEYLLGSSKPCAFMSCVWKALVRILSPVNDSRQGAQAVSLLKKSK